MISSWIYKYPPAPKVAALEAVEAGSAGRASVEAGSAGRASVEAAQRVAEELRLAYERGYRDAVQDVSRWGLDAVQANLSERGPV